MASSSSYGSEGHSLSQTGSDRPVIADFVNHQSKIIIEVDGGQHGSQVAKDEARSQRLVADGYRVLRFWNNDVLTNIEGVLTRIHDALTATPTPDPSPQGGGEK